MTCRCNSEAEHQARADAYRAQSAAEESRRAEERVRQAEARVRASTPDSNDYEIVAVQRVGPHLVLKVKYPSCTLCAFEGNKVMVYLNVTEVQVLKWRRIDPHFAGPEETKKRSPAHAPPPDARFPPTQAGWDDAVSYATAKNGVKR